jgi:hypothetical protein
MDLTPQQRDLLIRTIIGEAAAEPFVGQQAVANVVLNRLRSGRYGSTLEDVILAPKQFEPWAKRKDELLAIPQTADTYRTADMAVEAALQDDPTGGALNFYAPDVMEDRGGEPSWAANMRNNGTAREDRGTAWNSGYGEAAPAGLLDADPYGGTAGAEPDWEALKALGGQLMKKAMGEDEQPERQQPWLQHQVLQPLRRVTLKGLLG